MFYKYYYKYYPIIIVKFIGKIKDDNEFEKFLLGWYKMYVYNKQFILIFDTTQFKIPKIKYCFKMVAFIKKLNKKRRNVYIVVL